MPPNYARLSVVVPAFNEEEGVAQTLGVLVARLPLAQIILVDDCSTDRTLELALENPGVTVVSHSYNCGYGGALKTGVALADREFVAWFDADGEHQVDDLIRMYERASDDRLAAVIGQRVHGKSLTGRSLGKMLIRAIARSFDVRAGHDLNCGLRVYRRDVISRYLYVLPDGFSASLTSLMVMLERRYPLAYFIVTTGPRHGKSKVKLKDGFYAIATLIRNIMLFAPLRIFLRMGGAMFGFGLAYSLYVALYHGLGIPVAGATLMISGLLVLGIGLLADQISQIRLIQLASMEHLPHRPIREFRVPKEQ